MLADPDQGADQPVNWAGVGISVGSNGVSVYELAPSCALQIVLHGHFEMLNLPCLRFCVVRAPPCAADFAPLLVWNPQPVPAAMSFWKHIAVMPAMPQSN